MNKEITKRVSLVADYIIKTNSTIREASTIFNVSKSTIHKDMQERLYYLDKNKYNKVKNIMQKHIAIRHLRGGESTRQLFLKKRKLAL